MEKTAIQQTCWFTKEALQNQHRLHHTAAVQQSSGAEGGWAIRQKLRQGVQVLIELLAISKQCCTSDRCSLISTKTAKPTVQNLQVCIFRIFSNCSDSEVIQDVLQCCEVRWCVPSLQLGLLSMQWPNFCLSNKNKLWSFLLFHEVLSLV